MGDWLKAPVKRWEDNSGERWLRDGMVEEEQVGERSRTATLVLPRYGQLQRSIIRSSSMIRGGRGEHGKGKAPCIDVHVHGRLDGPINHVCAAT